MVEQSKSRQSVTIKTWIIKVISVLAAVLIWVIVTINQNPLDEKIFMVSLEQRSLAQGLILEKNVNQVQVRVQGTAAAINDLTTADISAYVDLDGVKAGKYELEVLVEYPDNVQILTRRPTSIEVELKETQTETFALTVDVVGEPASGYNRMEELVFPDEVRLTGAEDHMRRVDKVFVVADIHDIEADYDRNLSALVQDLAGNDITAGFVIEPKVVRVVVPVVGDEPERMMGVRVPISGEPALGYQLAYISTTPSVVKVFGDLNRLQALYHVDTEPVDISDLNADYSKTVRLAPANGFSVYPQEVTVSLNIEPVNSASVTKSIILCHNLDEGYTAEVEQLTLTIMVYGPETFIAALDEADIVPYVDCEGLSGGEYELPIRISLPANILLLNISEDTVDVTIIAPEADDFDEGIPTEEAVKIIDE